MVHLELLKATSGSELHSCHNGTSRNTEIPTPNCSLSTWIANTQFVINNPKLQKLSRAPGIICRELLFIVINLRLNKEIDVA